MSEAQEWETFLLFLMGLFLSSYHFLIFSTSLWEYIIFSPSLIFTGYVYNIFLFINIFSNAAIRFNLLLYFTCQGPFTRTHATFLFHQISNIFLKSCAAFRFPLFTSLQILQASVHIQLFLFIKNHTSSAAFQSAHFTSL